MSKTVWILDHILEKNPDGVLLNFSLKSNPASTYAGSVRRFKAEGAPDGLFEAHCIFPGKDERGRTAQVHTRLFFDGDDLATFMVPVEPPSIVTPEPGRVIPGLRGEGN